jgi:hypothetical protein
LNSASMVFLSMVLLGAGSVSFGSAMFDTLEHKPRSV